jgi:hypothetical protein
VPVLYRAVLPKADLTGAQLQGAVLFLAQLQGASLDQAQLQGASFVFARLEGASLDEAQLQGASLRYAHLEGASLDEAQLEGASFHYAHLEGASLDEAKLEGSSLDEAQLQGASLDQAQLEGASLKGTFFWRAILPEQQTSQPKDLFAPAGSPDWRPVFGQLIPGKKEPVRQVWTKDRYAALQQFVERVPVGEARDTALKRLAILDCPAKDDTLASCSPAVDPPAAVKAWTSMIEAASLDPDAYSKALATILGNLVCSNESDRIFVLRGMLASNRLAQTRSEMPGLAKRLKSSECVVSTTLTAFDENDIDEAVADPSRISSAKNPIGSNCCGNCCNPVLFLRLAPKCRRWRIILQVPTASSQSR